MKKFIAIAIVISSLNLKASAQSGWFWQNPLPQGNSLRSVHFTDSNIGWTVGDAGTILKTTNGGFIWTPQTSGTVNLSSVYFTDTNTGWAVGGNGILKTTNGGTNWTPQSSETHYLSSVYFTNSNTGWAVGAYGILKTTNGGSFWTYHIGTTSDNLYSVYFTDSNTGWAVGGEGGIIYKTTNGGTNWTPQAGGSTNWLFSVYFTDSNTGWAVGEYGIILKTTNGGINWTTQSSGTNTAFYFYLTSVYFTDSNTGWAVAVVGIDAETILKTTNSGSNWTPQSIGTYILLESVYFTDSNTGWVVGLNGKIFKTTNGGTSWTPETSGTSAKLYSVYFTDNNTGWAVGEYGTIIKTINGGSLWTAQTSETGNFLLSVHFIDNNTGCAVGYHGTILKTTNGGTNWTPKSSGTSNYLESVHFADSNTGWAVGHYGTILKTTNTGTNWMSNTSGTGNSLSSVYFTDSNTGWAVGGGGTILNTTNGGTNWMSKISGTGNSLSSVHFTDTNTGWAVGGGGTILKYNGSGSGSALLVITYPNGGETFLSGEQALITWNSLGVQSVKLEFTSNNGGTWSTLSASYPADSGHFAWTVPNINSTQCKIKITDSNDPGIYDISNSSFTISPITLNTGLIAYYPFNGNVNDESGNNNHGSNNGATFTTDINQTQNNALDFNGISNFVSIPDFNILNNNSLTFSCIVYPRSLNTSVSVYHGYSGEIQMNTYNGNQLGVGVKLADNNWYFSNANALPDNWYLLTGVWERGNSVKLYLNGQLQSQNSVPDYDLYEEHFHNSSIGAYSRFMYPSDARPFNGKIDEVRFYNRALSQLEIQSLYNQVLAFSKPVPYSKWISGESDTLRWINQGWTSYDIKCLLNYGTQNQSEFIIDSYITDTSYVWNIPDSLLSFRSKIIVQNSDNVNQSIESNIFRIKPYLLTKLNPDSTYYEYSIGRDNWRYVNNDAHFWFEDWYDQFNYWWIDPFTGRFYPRKYFKGSREKDFPDWVSWVNAFTIQACYSNYDNGEYSPIAVARWKAVKGNFPGACFGMALSNAMAFNYKSQFLRKYTYFPEFSNPHDVLINNNVRKITNELCTHQYGQPHLNFKIRSIDTVPRVTLESLKELLIQDSCVIKMLAFTSQCDTFKAAHIIIPFQVEKLFGVGEYKILTYDNRFPDAPTEFLINIMVNGGNGSWSSLSYNCWGGGKGFRLFDDVYSYFYTPSLLETNTASPFTVDDSLIQIYNPDIADFIIRDDHGNISGTINDSTFNNIENCNPVYAFGGFEVPPYMFNMGIGSYSIEYKNINTDTLESFLFTGNKSYSYSREQISSNQTDKLFFDGNLSVINEDSVTKQIALSSIVKESTDEKVISIKSLSLPQNDSIKLVNILDEDFKLITFGTQKQYELELNYVSPSGTERFINSDIVLSANSSHTIVPEWENISNGTLTILEDIGNNGTIDDTINLNNFSDLNLVLTAFIEGLYNSVINRMISDTVTILLREKIFPFAITDSARAILSSKGKGYFTFRNAQHLAEYYIVVKYRNAIEVWSDSTISLSGNSTDNYSFVDSASFAYGNNLIQVDSYPLSFALYSGDVNQDGIIDGSDQVIIDNDAFSFATGYLVSDLNGDSIVDASDAVIADNNAANFVSAVVP